MHQDKTAQMVNILRKIIKVLECWYGKQSRQTESKLLIVNSVEYNGLAMFLPDNVIQ